MLINSQKSYCLDTKVKLENLIKEQTEIAEWDNIKTGIEGEKDISRLLSGGYWNKQIQTLQDDRLPLNKKQITLQTRRRNHYSQLETSRKQARTQQTQIQANLTKPTSTV